MKKTALAEAAGCRRERAQDAKKEILANRVAVIRLEAIGKYALE
jgi:hypothetical protein